MRRALLSLLAVLALTCIPLPARADPPAEAASAQAGTACSTPAAVKDLASRATKIERVGKAVRFYMPAEALQVSDLGLKKLNSPVWQQGGYNYWHETQNWVEWLPSDPCSEPDGYAFGMFQQCLRRPVAGGASDVRLCNYAVWSTLQLYFAGAWDDPWGYREYHPINTTSCTDSGNFHFVSDAAHLYVRGFTRIQVRFLDIDHLTSLRRTTSYHVNAATKQLSGNPSWSPGGSEPEPTTASSC